MTSTVHSSIPGPASTTSLPYSIWLVCLVGPYSTLVKIWMGLDDNAVSHSRVTPCVQAGLAWAVVEITTADNRR